MTQETVQSNGAIPVGKPSGPAGWEAQRTENATVAREVPRIAEIACRFARARGRKTLVYLLGAADSAENGADIPITRRTAEQVSSCLVDKPFPSLDFLIQSSGGDIHAAYLITSLLQDSVTDKSELTACIPARAQSAATLLGLGAGRILLGELGFLGPLDAQIRKGVTDAGTPNYVSALHLLKSLSRLQEFSLESFSAMAGTLYDHQTSHDEQIKFGIKYSRGITRPLFERIDSGEAGRWDQMLRTGEEYGRRVLSEGKLIKDDELEVNRDQHIACIVHQLVYGYPSHEIVLDRGVLEKLLLRVETFGSGGRGDAVRRVSREFADCASETLIMFVDPFAYPDGPPPRESTDELPLSEWKRIGTQQTVTDCPRMGRDPVPPARNVVWTDEDEDGTTYAMRVALYRPAVERRRHWGEPARGGNGAPATQFYGQVSDL